ncbi:MAG: hypothetical protein IJN90_06415 [Bacilli bacterium]|nr:hypothetical protein [Bacilli bacterium]
MQKTGEKQGIGNQVGNILLDSGMFMKDLLNKNIKYIKLIHCYTLFSAIIFFFYSLLLLKSDFIDQISKFIDFWTCAAILVFCIIICILSFLGWIALKHSYDYDGWYDLRYKLSICLVLLFFSQLYLFQDILLIVYICIFLDVLSLYFMYFSSFSRKISKLYYKDYKNNE